MADISLQLLDSGTIYSPEIISGETVSLFVFEENFNFITSYITNNGAVSGQPVLIEFYIDNYFVFNPYVASDQEVSTNLLDQSEVYDVLRSDFVVSLNDIDSGVLYDVSSVFGKAIVPELIDQSEFFDVIFTGREISPNLVDGFEAYPILPRVEVRLNEISEFSFFNSTIEFKNEIVTEMLEGEFYDPDVFPGNVNINVSGFIDNSYIYPLRVRGTLVEPLRFKKADTIYGGDITRDYLASSQNYYPKDPVSDYDSRADFVYSPITNLMERYIPSNEALFSKTFYRAFYISNDSTFLERRNIDFWIDGGSVYTIDDKRINENRFFLEDEESSYGVLLDDRDEILNNGHSKTSMFNQMSVSYFLSPVRNLSNFNPDGSGVGIDLRSQIFTPGNTVTRIPLLGPGDYMGVYLRVNTNFIPDFPIKTDYSFLHLNYTTTASGLRESYPGQIKSGNTPRNQLLPSVYMRVTTDYTALQKYLEDDVEYIYSKYPPYFLSLEDIGRSR